MTWIWLFVWNVSWFIFALLYMSLETKLGGDPPQGRLGHFKLEHREVEAHRKRHPSRARRVHRH
jgi:hypothetical protein